MKYRIQVTVDGDRLAAVIEAAIKGAKFDPDLKVYGAPEYAATELAEQHGYALPRKMIDANQLQPPKPKRRAPASKAGLGQREAVIHATLKTGPKRWGELRRALSDGGLSEGTLNSLITKLKRENKINRDADGLWRLVQEHEHSHAEAQA